MYLKRHRFRLSAFNYIDEYFFAVLLRLNNSKRDEIMQNSYVKKILDAKVYDVAVETPLEKASFLSERLNNTVLVKREDLQPVFSFKIRGAYNRIARLSKKEREAGVIAASAGNHAQGVALSAAKLGIKAVIVMPSTTPGIKVESVRARGAEVVLHGDTFDEASKHARFLEKEHGYTFVHPYDEPDVIAGQGTVGMEILRQYSGHIDAIFVPVGGGGLIAGMAAYIKYLRPETKVIGVESEESACLKAAMEAGERVVLPHVGIFADGIAVAQIGEETFRICQQFVDKVVTVSTDEICAAEKDIFTDCRAISEPAGAASLAGLKKYVGQEDCTEKTFVAINSGANVNFDRLRHISERAEAGEKREAILAVTIPERPGSFKQFCLALNGHDISEFNYRYADSTDARIFVGVKLKDGDKDRKDLIECLKAKGYPVVDLSDNELAKLHIRHTVGGRAPELTNEIVFRFQFPERPGALMRFLDRMQDRWNCSLFHYRNHGAAFGRVMMGLQVDDSDRVAVKEFLDELGYEYWEETDNPAYKLFLG